MKGQTIRKDRAQSYGSKVILTMITMIARLQILKLAGGDLNEN